ncbi:FolC bifunctional protein [Choiromyces venosus 120613-1]|uniref:Folylpolyglutamate synthase n=1 Tax=Choiromyces venosus 120613-1 TaxID=1336337 RepID=A0A3N4JQ89_9PEZI|nr:FolC bifunctional protein [Choiromyces venosus 120613-1]
MRFFQLGSTILNRHRYTTATFYRTMASTQYPKTYEGAIAALNSLQSNFAILDEIRKSGKKMNTSAIAEMVESVRQLGYQPTDFDKLNVIHVAGTKGKGSTCAFTASILAQYKALGGAVSKIGLYTSPHLRAVRERIQLDGAPLSEELFAKYFFEVWDRLEASAVKEGRDPIIKPVYFRFLTLVAFHTYLRENVDTAIFEVGIGGEHDSTNVIQKPTVVGISSLGIDHTAVLGDTIEEIAWHKAGIIKSSARTFTVPQEPSALEVIQKRADEKGSKVEVVHIHPQIRSREVKLGLTAQFMNGNASLAVALAAEHLTLLGMNPGIIDEKLPERFVKGLAEVVWPGRCQVVKSGAIEWCIDGAHTVESLQVCGKWFGARADGIEKRVLIFNQQKRESDALIAALANSLKEILGLDSRIFDEVIFCTNFTFREKGHKADLVSLGTHPEALQKLSVQTQLAEAWKNAVPDTKVSHVIPTVEDAVEIVTSLSLKAPVQVLVTGSLHLVGAFLEVLDEKYPGHDNQAPK